MPTAAADTRTVSKYTQRWLARLGQLAEHYGVEDIENSELIYAHEAREARGETPEQVAKFLWGAA